MEDVGAALSRTAHLDAHGCGPAVTGATIRASGTSGLSGHIPKRMLLDNIWSISNHYSMDIYYILYLVYKYMNIVHYCSLLQYNRGNWTKMVHPPRSSTPYRYMYVGELWRQWQTLYVTFLSLPSHSAITWFMMKHMSIGMNVLGSMKADRNIVFQSDIQYNQYKWFVYVHS